MKGLPVIVSTHDYIDGSGKSVTGRMMWDGFVKNNPMVFMVLNGHTHTEYALVNHNARNRPVYQMLSDYQDRANCGNGLMRLITIDPAQSKIKVKTFSPYYENADAEYFETDCDSQFEYDVNVRSGSPTTPGSTSAPSRRPRRCRRSTPSRRRSPTRTSSRTAGRWSAPPRRTPAPWTSRSTRTTPASTTAARPP